MWCWLQGRAGHSSLDEKTDEHGRDGIFSSMRILSGPLMADAVIAATIFHPHFPRMKSMQCDREGDSGVICLFDASLLLFILFGHFILLPFRWAAALSHCCACLWSDGVSRFPRTR
jgi:hypothetical protein